LTPLGNPILQLLLPQATLSVGQGQARDMTGEEGNCHGTVRVLICIL